MQETLFGHPNKHAATVQTSRISLACHKHCTDDAAKYRMQEDLRGHRRDGTEALKELKELKATYHVPKHAGFGHYGTL